MQPLTLAYCCWVRSLVLPYLKNCSCVGYETPCRMSKKMHVCLVLQNRRRKDKYRSCKLQHFCLLFNLPHISRCLNQFTSAKYEISAWSRRELIVSLPTKLWAHLIFSSYTRTPTIHDVSWANYILPYRVIHLLDEELLLTLVWTPFLVDVFCKSCTILAPDSLGFFSLLFPCPVFQYDKAILCIYNILAPCVLFIYYYGKSRRVIGEEKRKKDEVILWSFSYHLHDRNT